MSSQPSSSVEPNNSETRRQTMLTWLITVLAIAFFAWRSPDSFRIVVTFIIVLSILVFVHEWGHYQFARWAGMKVNRFGIGFPPWIATIRRNNIDYSIGALPIGGMVDIAGLGSEEEMVATAKDSSGIGTTATAATAVEGGATENANAPSRLESYQYRNPDAPHGTKNFQDAGLGWRFWTLFAGPLMNFLFALVVFIGVFSIAGVPDKASSTNRVEAVQPGMPAAAAGIQAGDVIVAINGVHTNEPKKISELIRANAGKAVVVTLQRGDKTLQKSMAPVMEEIDLDGDGKAEKAALIGVNFYFQIDSYKKVGLLTAAQLGVASGAAVTGQIFGLLKRAATANLSKDDKRGVGGPVKIAQAVGQSAKRGWQETAILMAALSVNLGLLNLLPIPALDGGRILFLGYELVAGRPLDPKKEGVAHMVGMALLLAFMLFITLRDVIPFFPKLG